MGLQEFWFILLAVLFLGFFVLEGFDFGVGMLMVPLGRVGVGDSKGRSAATREDVADKHRRAVLNTIGPVWDGNEVWLITAGGAMFAAFPEMYATVFSTLYMPLLVILVAMILRVVAIEWRGKIDDPAWRRTADIGIAIGSYLPAILWGVAFAILVRGVPIDADKRVDLSITDVLNPYTLLGGLATASLFAFHGAVFIVLRTTGAVHGDARRFATRLALPATVLVAGFGLWTQLSYGKSWTWAVLAVAVVAQLAAVAVVLRDGHERWAFLSTTLVVAAVVALLFGAMFPNLVPSTLNPEWSVTVYNGSSSPYTLRIMTWVALIAAPLVVAYQSWTYYVFRQRISAEAIPASIGLSRRAP